jgi:hypothetical protein
MKTLKLVFGIVLFGILISSCNVEENHYYEEDPISIDEIMTRHEIWYVDYNNTIGDGSVPFVSKAFTLSFIDGVMYANNNIVGLGFTGDKYGIVTGTYASVPGDFLQINHDIDGVYNFEVIVDSYNHIRLYNASKEVTYYLDGYSRDSFNFNSVYYDNIEYFLQEYIAWRKIYTSAEGDINDFDYENYLAFTPEDITTFYSSQDVEGALISDLIWDFEGSYKIENIIGHDDMKYLTLYYDSDFVEEFELTVLDDTNIELYHMNSGTTYEFQGNGFIQYKNRNNARVRKIVKRNSIAHKPHKTFKNTRK